MATVVASDLIRSALRLIGAVAQGETPTADETTDALAAMNDILDAWNLQNLMVFRNENDVYSIAPGQQTYTIGPGANLNGIRPTEIEQAFVTYQGIDFPLRILTTREWNDIPLKSFAAPLPNALYYVSTNPVGSVYLWPVPTLALPLILSVNMQFGQFAATDTINLPPGYLRLLRYALAIDLAPEYGIQPRPDIMQAYKDILGNVKAENRQMPLAKFDPSLADPVGVGLAGFLGGY